MIIGYNLKWKCEPAHHCVKIKCEGPMQEISQTCKSHQNARAKLRRTDKTDSVKSKKKKLPVSEELITLHACQFCGKRYNTAEDEKINDD